MKPVIIIIGLLVLLTGYILISQGAFSAVNGGSPADAGLLPEINNGVQVVNSRFYSRKYEPIVVKRNIPVKWNIQIDAGDLNGCNNAIVIPRLGIEKRLRPGDNLIEFTAPESGDISYSCWMGMIRIKIKVVD